MVQGVFFFAYPGKSTLYYHFAGMIHPEEDGRRGMLNDKFGDSFLTDVVVTETEVRFTKTYEGRTDPIHYTLKKKSDSIFWTGHYDGEKTGSDQVNCLITEVPIVAFLSPAERTGCRQFFGALEVGVGAHDHPLNQ